jgi:hypothetical protein
MLGGDWELGQHLSKIETRRTVVAIWENPPQTCTAAILLSEQFCYFEMLPPLALPGE